MYELALQNGKRIPQMGFGVFRTQDGEETTNAVRWALEAGYRHIDTATGYGNEKSVGIGIRESGVPREKIFLTTKLSNADNRAGRAAQAFQESLDALGTDYVDLYLIHWPVEGSAEAWKEIEREYEAGRIKTIGVSNFHLHHLDKLARTAQIMPMVNQIESNPGFVNQPLIDACKERGMVVEAWSALGGSLDGNVLKRPQLMEIASRYGKTTAQVVIRWHLQRGLVVLTKSTHKDRIVSNYDVFDFSLLPEDMAAISAMNINKRVGSDPDKVDF